MKNLNKVIMVCSLAGLISSGGCSKLDINIDPNKPLLEKANPESLIPSGVISTAGRVGGDLAIVGGIWSQHWTQNNSSSQYISLDTYDVPNSSSFINSPYQELYSGALADYQLAIEKAVVAKDWRYNLMATVMRAYTYQVLVDLFDKVPYTEALKVGTFLQPKFDDGYTIYKSLIEGIDAALAKDFHNTPHLDTDSRIDLVFGDNGNASFEDQMENWERFANTLKLKMYLRMAYVKPTEAEAGIKAMYDGDAKFLTTNAGVAGYENVPNKSNPLFEYNFRRLNTTDNLKASATLVSWLEQNADPRAQVYFGVDSPVPTINQGDFWNQSSHPEYFDAVVPVIAPTAPVWFITKAESCFMQAEFLERYYGGSGAELKYNEGVTAAFTNLGLPGPTTLLAGPYKYPTTANLETKIEKIIVQKWASLFGSHALEAFFEQNRTGYPRISPVYSTEEDYQPGTLVYASRGVTGAGNFPRRLVYPEYEKSRNTNTPAEVPIYTKVWWGK
ncbi:SusD/RagB family nutrient-binding outer membrane lipoprotein [Pedobacter panaciterrae]|uniref:SusD/RagB family nutrient-binding outer membrane lipoprotein n=1 Tax=Pedobacter panaciterrae TaxID=363849 RepID=A0ABU8NRM2_9SPHI|nr:SusD/RagB family nutrient-binding outer membrane lipoprotein [uncultured Pedobacter sp.]